MTIPPPPVLTPEPLNPDAEWRDNHDAPPSPQKRNRRRARRRGDPVSFTAGIALGAGLMLIVINLIAEVWLV